MINSTDIKSTIYNLNLVAPIANSHHTKLFLVLLLSDDNNPQTHNHLTNQSTLTFKRTTGHPEPFERRPSGFAKNVSIKFAQPWPYGVDIYDVSMEEEITVFS